jgi:hypothetical protein
MGMGKSAVDVLPELRRKGITASGNSFSMGGQIMGAPEIANALRLQVSTLAGQCLMRSTVTSDFVPCSTNSLVCLKYLALFTEFTMLASTCFALAKLLY